ncbi:hypothetical protein L2E82_33084 [Cichorium intybus]|uniref:Uncharacterized protein n=1 Tax=Cichorium intybus TaxID=13427 RepID=A0ACB9BJ80_CICIN|nr:hypothetical protein L2E82_33084 [Cichorium intybus]
MGLRHTDPFSVSGSTFGSGFLGLRILIRACEGFMRTVFSPFRHRPCYIRHIWIFVDFASSKLPSVSSKIGTDQTHVFDFHSRLHPPITFFSRYTEQQNFTTIASVLLPVLLNQPSAFFHL